MSGNKTWGFVLAFLGSLAYLYVAFTLLNGVATGWTAPAAIFGGFGAFFVPLFLGLGVVGAVSLFLTSFGLMKGGKMAEEWAMKIAFLGGISLVALTAGSVWAWYALLGFVLATLGTIIATM